MIIYSIYKCVNRVNGKVYIGFDSNWPKRMTSHRYRASSKKSLHHHFHNAIIKYGGDSFDWELIYQSKNRDHTLHIMEPFFIQEYDSFRSGYNMTLGGEGTFGKFLSQENRLRLSEITKQRSIRSKWYNNGERNSFSEKHPGDGWMLGRINQKPTTKGNRWYNNGETQLLCKVPPDGWKLGMLSRKATVIELELEKE